MSNQSLLDRLRAHLAESRLFAQPGLAILAVSGGGDSVAMLDLLAELAPELDLSLLVAHADHGILPESGAVARDVRALARERYGLECVVGTLALGAGASETRARAARYRFLRQVQRERDARYLATAHHADDQIETVLLRLLRGSAPAGLAGIAARAARGLIRPLLPFRRAALAAHAASLGVRLAADPANTDPRHLRSWLRTALWPVIEDRLGDEGARAVLRAARHAEQELRAWDALLDLLSGPPGGAGGEQLRTQPGRFDVARSLLSGYHNVLAARILRSVARRAGMQLSPRAASRLARFMDQAASGRRLTVPGGLRGEMAFDHLVVAAGEPAPEERSLAGTEGETRFGRFWLRWTSEAAPHRVARRGWTTWLDADALAVRPPAAGDRMMPLGGVGHRKVARLLMEARVPRGERAGYPVLVSRSEVLWVPGVCRGVASIPQPGTQSVRVDVGIG